MATLRLPLEWNTILPCPVDALMTVARNSLELVAYVCPICKPRVKLFDISGRTLEFTRDAWYLQHLAWNNYSSMGTATDVDANELQG